MSLEPAILGCATALPQHYYSQDDLLEALERLWGQRHFNVERLRQFHHNLNIQGRHLAMPKEAYFEASTFSQRNQVFVEVGLELAQRCLTQITDVALPDISHIFFTTVTGLAVPSLEARLMNRLPFSPYLKRSPLFGLGCLGGAAGVARAADYLRGAPREAVILLSVELCSLTLQAQDLSVPNLVSSGLFGDGAAAVLLVGGEHPLARGPRVIASRSVFFPDSEHVMGWEIGEHGFKVVLSPEVPDYARHHLAPALQLFLADHGLTVHDIAAWVAHPGGPRVIQALGEALQLPLEKFAWTSASLAEVGNLSSASVLFVLRQALAQEWPTGSYGIVLAMGPAFCAEVVLIQW